MRRKAASVLEEYARREDEERRALVHFDNEQYLAQRDTMLLGIGPDAGQFLNLLIRAQRPRTIVELGTAFGYSTLWLAEAAADVNAEVVTFDPSPEKHEYSQTMLRKAGLDANVRFVTGDAIHELGAFNTPVSFALIDLWKDLYIHAFDALLPHLASDCIVCADNMLFPEYQREDALRYIAHVEAQQGFHTMTIPVGSGIEFTAGRQL